MSVWDRVQEGASRLSEQLEREKVQTSSFSSNTLLIAVSSGVFTSMRPLEAFTGFLPSLLHAPFEAAMGAFLGALALEKTALKNEFGEVTDKMRTRMTLAAFASTLLISFALTDRDYSPFVLPLVAGAGVMLAGGLKKDTQIL